MPNAPNAHSENTGAHIPEARAAVEHGWVRRAPMFSILRTSQAETGFTSWSCRSPCRGRARMGSSARVVCARSCATSHLKQHADDDELVGEHE